jgi:methyl-accepting chemotaxis protein
MNFTISRRLGLLVSIAALISLALVAIQLVSLRRSLLHERETGVKMQVEQATSVVKAFGDAAAAGRMTNEVAQQRAAEAVRAMRFGQGDYFFVYDYAGVNRVHGLKAENEGKNLIGAQDSNGTRFNADLIAAAQRGGGYVGFLFPRAGQEKPSPKLAYALSYAPWQWVIGTGVYLDDLDEVFWDRAMTAIVEGLGLLAVLAGCAWYLARGLVNPIHGLTGTMGRLAGGELEAEVVAQDRRDEVGQMARAVQVFKDNGLRARALEAEAAAAREAAEAERARNEAERAAAAEQQAAVVAELAEALALLAEGDLTRQVRAFPQDYKKLEQDFNAAIVKLQNTISVIAGNSRGIHSGTGEISQAADNLSKRTEQQAASLEETAAALDEITATVRKTAEGANHARQVVSTAKSDAEHSGTVVRDAVAAMTEIEKSSSQISQIIGVIDEIAFQTNLLALNAGVEAARAGDAGKGFAVVASEVRALAQRSAEAAKEIKALISASTTQVASGVELVGETGKALDRIAAQVTEINAIVAEIAASAQEQATALAEVNTAVNQMDQMTQQNAAMVEESTAASHSLAEEAEKLTSLVSQFKTGQDIASAAPARRAAPAAKPAPASRTSARPAASRPATRGNTALAIKAEAAEESWEEF